MTVGQLFREIVKDSGAPCDEAAAKAADAKCRQRKDTLIDYEIPPDQLEYFRKIIKQQLRVMQQAAPNN